MGGKSKTKSKTDNSIDPWSKAQYESGKAKVQGILDQNPFQSYSGNRVAGLSEIEKQAMDNYAGQTGVAGGILNTGVNMAKSAYSGGPSSVNYQGIEGKDLSGYMDPYLSAVMDSSMNDLEKARRRTISQGEAGVHSSAFGGSRHGVSDALTNEAYLDQVASTSAGLRSNAFNNAQALAMGDAQGAYDASKTNAGLAEQYRQGILNSAGLMGSLGTSMGNNAISEAQMMTLLGTNARAVDQAGLDAQYQEFLRAQEDPYRRAQVQMGLLGSTPIITDSSSTSTQSQTPGVAGVLGTGLGLASGLGWQPFM